MKNNKKIYIFLHSMLFIYSMSGIMSKLASNEAFLSLQFIIYYCVEIMLLFIYAIGWQQILKRFPLSVAFANKAVTIIWACIWGALIFNESLSIVKITGIFFIVIGIIVFSSEHS